MISEARLNLLQAHLAEHDVLSVADAMNLLDASPATVRRDFHAMVTLHLARRVRGGLALTAGPAGMTPFAQRALQAAPEKAAIAKRAAALITANQVVIIDGGTSTFHLASCLGERPVRVITNSLRLANAISERRDSAAIDLHLTGGYLYPGSGLLIGPQARAGLAGYHADWAFLSVGGISTTGISNTDDLVIEVEQAMIAAADKVAILADHTKLGRQAMRSLGGLDQVDVLVTDQHPASAPIIKRLRAAGIQVLEVAIDGRQRT